MRRCPPSERTRVRILSARPSGSQSPASFSGDRMPRSRSAPTGTLRLSPPRTARSARPLRTTRFSNDGVRSGRRLAHVRDDWRERGRASRERLEQSHVRLLRTQAARDRERRLRRARAPVRTPASVAPLRPPLRRRQAFAPTTTGENAPIRYGTSQGSHGWFQSPTWITFFPSSCSCTVATRLPGSGASAGFTRTRPL